MSGVRPWGRQVKAQNNYDVKNFFHSLLQLILMDGFIILGFYGASRPYSISIVNRGVNKDSLVGVHFFTPLEFFPPPLEKYHDVYQSIGFNWVSFAFSTHFWHLQTPTNKGFISILSAFTLFYILRYSHSF